MSMVHEPRKQEDDAIILACKAQDTKDGEKQLSDTVTAALKQIAEKDYETLLAANGMKGCIRRYGFQIYETIIFIE